MSKGLFVGRFQPFHKGHLSLIEKALEEVDELIIGIGSSQFAYTKYNPFTDKERDEMIKDAVNGNCKIINIPDINDYPRWVEHVEKIIPEFDVVYTGRDSDITKRLFREKGYEVRHIEDGFNISATKIRDMMANGGDWEKWVPESTADVIEKKHGIERMRYLFENYKYENPTPTVDGIINYNGRYVLIKRKKSPFKDKLAIPGGHVEKGETLKECVIREIQEETGLVFDVKGYLGPYDDPDRDPRGHYITHVFYGEATGELKAGDDAAEVILLTLEDALDQDLAFDHINILRDYSKQVENDG